MMSRASMGKQIATAPKSKKKPAKAKAATPKKMAIGGPAHIRDQRMGGPAMAAMPAGGRPMGVGGAAGMGKPAGMMGGMSPGMGRPNLTQGQAALGMYNQLQGQPMGRPMGVGGSNGMGKPVGMMGGMPSGAASALATYADMAGGNRPMGASPAAGNPMFERPAVPGMKKGGKVAKMAMGGKTRGDGCAMRGKTKGRNV